MRRRVCLTQIVLLGLVALLAASCVAPPVAGPQVMVTRVPLDLRPADAVKVASAGTPSEIGDGVPPVGVGTHQLGVWLDSHGHYHSAGCTDYFGNQRGRRRLR